VTFARDHRNGSQEARTVSDHVQVLADDYASALEQFLSDPEEGALAQAHHIGRTALANGCGVLEIATAHSRAITHILEQPLSDGERQFVLDSVEKFFIEALAPFEMAHRGFWEANMVLRRLNDVLEGHAKRIASALHDDAAQLLASVHLALADIARVSPDCAPAIDTARAMLDDIEQRLRNLAHELRPPILDDMGLVPALEFLGDSMQKRWGLPVTVHATIDRALPATVETTLYRITQEALTNVARHAKATRAQVSLQRAAQRIACSISDDGIGFDPKALSSNATRGIGLLEIEERVAALGGVFCLARNQLRGTNLTVEIPLEH
jgi:signal transduction histidine kinase